MGESAIILKNASPSVSRSARERMKSMRDIMNQYDRIRNRLYSRYLNYEIELEDYDKGIERLNGIYDRYETNILNQSVPGWRRGMNYPVGIKLDKPVKRSVYAKNK